MTDGNVADAARLAQRNRTGFIDCCKNALTPGQFKADGAIMTMSPMSDKR